MKFSLPTIQNLAMPGRLVVGGLIGLVVAALAVSATAMASQPSISSRPMAGHGLIFSGQASSTALAGTTSTPRANKAFGKHPLALLLVRAEVTALGITPKEFRADRARGMTLHEIADTKGLSEGQLQTELATELQPLLDQAVTAGSLTAAQEAKLLAKVRKGPIPGWDKAPTVRSGRLHSTAPPGTSGKPASI